MTCTNRRDTDDNCPCPAWLIPAIETLLQRSPVPLARIAEVNGISPDILYSYMTDPHNRSARHRCLPARRIIPLTIAAQSYALLDALEAQVGRHAHRVEVIAAQDLPREMAQAIGRAGEMITTMAKELEDGQIDSREAKELGPLLKEHQERLARLQVALQLREAQE